jgi:hypothetical protein
MDHGKETVSPQHPRAWVVRIVEGRGMRVADKTLSWWRAHLEMLLKCCQEAGLEASEIWAACTQDRCLDCFDLDAAKKNSSIQFFSPISPPNELSNLFGLPFRVKRPHMNESYPPFANSKRVSALL